ncbi:MAG: inositol monophosphatase [Spirochaetia bacterium]|nr:inositol monophosphatase [Spirochaetia bacterium]MCF7946320.1 inositol monophosphatase [Spirochaetia bacterium]
MFNDTDKKNAFLKLIKECSDYAVDKQKDSARNYKADGSVLTQTDIHINKRITDAIQKIFPECGIISEEEQKDLTGKEPFIFVVDPIDGTDVYSQGMPSWCIAVGILDNNKKPVGGIIAAPRWGIGTKEGLFLYSFPDDEDVFNQGEIFLHKNEPVEINQMIVCSGSHKSLCFNNFDGKLRSFGSNILHILSPAIHPNIDAAVFAPCYIWDIAAAHAIIRKLGLEIMYTDNNLIDYNDLLDRSKSRTYAAAAYIKSVSKVLEIIHNH